MAPLSVVIRARDGGRRLGISLASVRWAERLIVVDETGGGGLDVPGRAYNAEVVGPGPAGSALRSDAGFDRVAGEWLLVLYAGEEVSDDLGEEIRRVLAESGTPDGYIVKRMMNIHGKWVRHDEPGRGAGVRLFRKGRLVRPADPAGYAVTGRTGRLASPLRAWPDDSISDYLRSMNRDTSLAVAEMLHARPGYVPGFAGILGGLLTRFLGSYIAGGCWRAGVGGLLLSGLDSLAVLALRSKLWEYHAAAGASERPPVDMEGIRAMERRYAR